MPTLAPGSQAYLVRFLLLALASTAATVVGFLLLPEGGSAALLWPMSAVGIAALFLFGIDLWPALTLSILGVLLWRNGNLPLDLGIALADTIEAVAGAYFLRKYVALDPMLARLRDSLGLLVACIAPTMIAAIFISATSYLTGQISIATIGATFSAIWIGHAVSGLSFSAFLIRWLHRPIFYKTKDELIEGAIIFGSLSIISYLLFWTPYGSVGSISMVYLLLIPLLWASLRTGPRGTTLALALMAGIGMSGLQFGYGPLTTSHNPQSVFLLQVLLGALDVIFLIITSIVEERKEAIVNLSKNVVQLEQAIEKIRSEDQAKSNFLAILAHELRNPLAPIITSAELMKGSDSNDNNQEHIETIEAHARTISLLLDDLLDITRITHNKFELRRERIPVSKSVERVLQSVQPFYTLRKHTLNVELPQEELYVDADPVRFEQILVNLLNNAGKYTDAGGTITFVCVKDGRNALIRVTDNGIGIAADKLPGVFQPFGQRGAVVRSPGGLGVGLSLTKQLAELHDGTVDAFSAGLGKGSTFTVRMPLSQGPTINPSQAARSFVNRLRGKATRTILVVDDNEPAAKGLAELLRRQGHTIHTAYTGEEALAQVQRHRPDTVILDIGLPDMTGYEVAEKMRTVEGLTLRIIALTGYGQEDDKIKARVAGFDAHLVKPVMLADIESVL
jgi:signal transduction histidine kinase/CheY-like chemotaxis protein